MKALILAWLAQRWAEPESRAGVVGATVAAAAFVFGKIDLGTFQMMGLGGILAFALPGPVAKQILDGVAGAGKKLILALALAGLALGLSACGAVSPTQVADQAAGLVQVAVPAQDVVRMKAACQSVKPELATATSLPTVADTAVFPAAFCQKLLAGDAVPLDGNSLNWLSSNLGTVDSLARAAGVILPIAAKALPLLLAVL